MKIDTPQIAWHDRSPVYSVDIQSVNQVDAATGKTWYRLASSGADSQIIIWKVFQRRVGESTVRFEVLSQLVRHERAVNVVRFVPTGEDTLASADVDGLIYIWKKGELDRFTTDFEQQDKVKSPPKRTDIAEVDEDDEEVHPLEGGSFEDEIIKVENWNQFKVLRGHLEDVVDISWSADGNYLISGSVDNESIVWDVNKGCKIHMLSGHKSWVQGVAYDPLNEFLATISADRSLRIFSADSKKNMFRIDRGKLMHEGRLIKSRLFYDYTLQSFTRRLSFSPAGEFLLVPSGVLEFPKPIETSSLTPSKKITSETSQDRKVNDDQVIEVKKSSHEKNSSQVMQKKEDEEKSELDKRKQLMIDLKTSPVKTCQEIDPPENHAPTDCNKRMEIEEPNEKEYDGGDEDVSGDDDDIDDEDDEVQVTRVKLPPPPPEEPELNYINCCHLFLRSDISKPLAYLPVGDKFCHAVRFCPTRFQLIPAEDVNGNQEEEDNEEQDEGSNTFPFPYRLVFAVATQNSVILYDSQHMSPFGFITDIHYARISDITWSSDGRLLMISSTDGYCTFVTFNEGEIGIPYEGEAIHLTANSSQEETSVEPPAPEVFIKTPSVGQFFSKLSREERMENVEKELQALDSTPKQPRRINFITLN
jgi:WD40 repeat protein